MNIDDFLPKFEIELLDRYNRYTKHYINNTCKIKNCKVSSLEHEAYNLNFTALKEAITQVKMDLSILSLRRGNLIGAMRMSEGKIAGMVTYAYRQFW